MADIDDLNNDSAYSMPMYMQPTTTPEAQAYSREILTQDLNHGREEGEGPILGQMEKTTQQAVQALRDAQGRLGQQQFNKDRLRQAFFGALGAPTRSGSMGESGANASRALEGEEGAQQNFDLQKAELMSRYGLAIPQAQQPLLDAKLKLQQMHEAQNAMMDRAALTTLGRSIIPGAGALSPNARVAISEGLQPGTPQFVSRVKFLDDQAVTNAQARAGTDNPQEDAADTQKLAYKYGVPGDIPAPWRDMPVKAQVQAREIERRTADQQLNKDDASVLQAQDVQRSLDRFMYLNKEYGTSRLQGVPGVSFLTSFSPTAVEMDKLSKRLGPLLRQPGMGRMTNYDLQTFLGSTVGRDKPYSVNQSIYKASKIALDNQLAWNEFEHNFFLVHGHLQGARQAWDSYLNANPIFDPKSPVGAFKLNSKREDYKDWFRKQMDDKSSGGGETGTGYPDVSQADMQNPIFAGLTPAEIHAAKQPAHAAGGRVGFAAGGGVQRNDDYKADLADLARSLEQGSLFQWGDEANAALSPGQYGKNVGRQRAMMERFGDTHPGTDLALQAAGAGLSSYAGTKLLQSLAEHAHGKTGKLAMALAALDRMIPKSLALRAGLTGAGAGALAGAGSAQNAGHVPGAALQQGILGGVLGPLAGLAGRYGVTGAGALADRMVGRAVPAGARRVLAALERDRMSPADIGARLQGAARAGVPSTVGDVGGPAVQALRQGVATHTGPDVDAMAQALEQRQAGAHERVADLVNRSLKPDDYSTKLKELTDALYQNAKPLYEKAYAAFPKVKSKVIFDLLGTPSGKTAAKTAFKLMQDAGEPVGEVDAKGMIRKPSLRFLDYTKRALDDQINTEERNGATQKGKVLRDMRNRLRGELDEATGGANSPYADARKQYGGDLEVLDALKTGREDFNKMTPRDIKAATANMSFAEKDAMRSGVAENLFTQLAQTPYTTNPAAKLANVPAVAQKLQALFDKPREYQDFMTGLQQEMSNFTNARRVIGTAARARGAEQASELGGPHLGEAAYEATLGAAGHPVWAGARLGRAVANKLMRGDTANSAAKILAGANPQDMRQLEQQAAQLLRRNNIGRTAGLTAAGIAGNVTAPNPWGNLQDQQQPTGFDDGGSVHQPPPRPQDEPGLTSIYEAQGKFGVPNMPTRALAAQIAYMQAFNPNSSNDYAEAS
jgi:hypothetical protein